MNISIFHFAYDFGFIINFFPSKCFFNQISKFKNMFIVQRHSWSISFTNRSLTKIIAKSNILKAEQRLVSENFIAYLYQWSILHTLRAIYEQFNVKC